MWWIIADINDLSPGVFDSLLAEWQLATSDWGVRSVAAGFGIFGALATLWWLKGVLQWSFVGYRREVFYLRAIGRLIAIVLMFAIYLGSSVWVIDVLNVFANSAGALAGFDTVSPSGIFQVQLKLHQKLWTSGWNFFDLFKLYMLPVTFRLIASIALWVATVFVAVRVTKLYVEAFVMVPAGLWFLAFMPHEATRPIADGYLGYVLDLGARFFGTLVVYSSGLVILDGFVDRMVEQDYDSMVALVVMSSVMAMYAVVVWTMGEKLSERLGVGRISFGQLARLFF